MKKAQLKRKQVSCKAQLKRKQVSCKAQLKIQEMSFMLVAVVLFIILVGLFALSIFYTNLYKRANEIAEERTLSAITNLADSPEFSCTGTRSNCVDADKVIALMNNKNYKNFWEFSSLRILKQNIFNKTKDEWVECSQSNYPDCDVFTIYTKEDKNIECETIFDSFIALCRKEQESGVTYEKCEIAKFWAGAEVKDPDKGCR